jgi:hypothetical protein
MKNYRGWKLVFSDGVYTATKKGRVPLRAESRVAIDRRIDAHEFVEWRDEFIAKVKQANEFIKFLQKPVDPRHILCHNFAFPWEGGKGKTYRGK